MNELSYVNDSVAYDRKEVKSLGRSDASNNLKNNYIILDRIPNNTLFIFCFVLPYLLTGLSP